MISVEDLWDLKLQDLDSVFKLLNKEKKQSDEEKLQTINKNDLVVGDLTIIRTGQEIFADDILSKGKFL